MRCDEEMAGWVGKGLGGAKRRKRRGGRAGAGQVVWKWRRGVGEARRVGIGGRRGLGVGQEGKISGPGETAGGREGDTAALAPPPSKPAPSPLSHFPRQKTVDSTLRTVRRNKKGTLILLAHLLSQAMRVAKSVGMSQLACPNSERQLTYPVRAQSVRPARGCGRRGAGVRRSGSTTELSPATAPASSGTRSAVDAM